MKTKNLLLVAVLAASTLCLNAQRLLISEEFSSPEWQAELLRLNPGSTDGTVATLINPNAPNVTPYAPKSPATIGTNVNASYNTINSTDLYFGKYKLSGDIETIGGMASDVCAADGTNHNVYIATGAYAGSYLPVGLRPTKPAVTGNPGGYFQLPKLPNAGRIYFHVRGGNNTTATELNVQELIDGTWSTKNTAAVKKRSLLTTTVDENLYYNVNTRDSVTLRIVNLSSSLPYFQIYEINVEEHASVELKQSIDSAIAIRAANAENIGTAFGQYPQAVYDSLGVVITTSTGVYENLDASRATLLNNITKMNDAITYFYANVNDIGTGFNPINTITLKQYGRKLVTSEATRISIFNTDGTLLYQQDNVKIMDVPASIRQGIYLVKSKSGVQKMYFGE